MKPMACGMVMSTMLNFRSQAWVEGLKRGIQGTARGA
jgi:hypothetical protein